MRLRSFYHILEKCFLPGGILEMGLKLVAPVGVRVGVEPKAVNDAIIVGGSCLGISKPRSFKFTSLHAILNSLMFIFPSWSVSANALYSKINNVQCIQNNK